MPLMDVTECPACRGEGELQVRDGIVSRLGHCHHCDGTGEARAPRRGPWLLLVTYQGGDRTEYTFPGLEQALAAEYRLRKGPLGESTVYEIRDPSGNLVGRAWDDG